MTDRFRKEVRVTLTGNILAFWQERMYDGVHGGFLGAIDGQNRMVPDAPKGAVLNARILWAFSAAYRVLGDERYRQTAQRSLEYLLERFVDREHGGVYWSLDAQGMPLDTKKQIYAQGFAIYGLSEYYRATDERQALAEAIAIYEAIERHSFDPVYGGYFEAFTSAWEQIGDVRLSEKDANDRKTMNTHLHILEPYTNLYRVWPDQTLRARIIALIGVFLDRIYDPATHHLGLFFGDDWQVRPHGCSYGHDIEASWLLLEAAIAVGDPGLTERVRAKTRLIAQAATEGLQADGSMIYEQRADGTLDTQRHWWVEAECVVGLLWLWRYHGDEQAFEQATACWEYIKTHLIDREHGEWLWGVYDDGTPNTTDDKAGFWKCPYHNVRMCLEVLACTQDR